MEVSASGGLAALQQSAGKKPDQPIEPAMKTPAERTADMITLSPAAKAKLVADAKSGI
ncbi:hypothetical protein [Donghicola mangrovi]|uniref:Uncharacterized protein n=1 Tax=Donghicola mangrovi TaxID=2729614 RepID=A0A850Q527_9RHOB|nr:hypothetical protein [Donghicola mangrovi]NVO24817.1 hypothetical protein [Donghicola mangrovi]